MKTFYRFIFCTVICFCIFACNSKKQPQDNGAQIYQSPQFIPFTALQPAKPDTGPKPQTIVIPNAPTTYKKQTESGPQVVQLMPPSSKPAGFFVHMQNYNTEESSLNNIACSYIDHLGNIWFSIGTFGGGVCRYDGKSYTTYTSPACLTTSVTCILEDKKGNMWFGTKSGGVCRYDGKSCTTFSTPQGLSNPWVLCMLEDKTGNIWFGTADGVDKYDGKTFTTLRTKHNLADSSIISMLEDRDGNLWLGTHGAGVYRYDGKSFINFCTKQGLSDSIIYCILQDTKGNMWFGTHKGGVSRYDGKKFTTFNTVQGLANNEVRSIHEDKSGDLWFGTWGGGISRYDGKIFTTFSTEQGLANNIVRSITEDKSSNLWFCTFGGGVDRYNGKSVTTFTTEQGLAHNIVWSIGEDKSGDLWFGTDGGGVSRYDGKSFTNYTTAQGLPANVVMDIIEDKKNNIWFGTQGGGLTLYDGKSFTTFTRKQGLLNSSVDRMLEDKTGNLWFDNLGQLFRYNGESFTNFSLKAEGNILVLSMLQDRMGKLWFGTNGDGLSCYDGKAYTCYTTAQGLPTNDIRSIWEDKNGNLWLGTTNGLSRYDGKSFANYTSEQGLSDDLVSQVIQDKDGRIYMGTKRGISVLAKFIRYNLKSKRYDTVSPGIDLNNQELSSYIPVFEIYNEHTGYPIKNVNRMYMDSKGIIWVGTGSDKTALVRFDYSSIHRNPNQPAIIIQSVKLNEENICWYDLSDYADAKNENKASYSNDSATLALQEINTYGKVLSASERDTIRTKFTDVQFDSVTPYYPLPEHLVLPYQHNHISFEFAAIEPARPNLVSYQYILEGYEKEWSPVSNKTSATFGNISEGSYTFKLRARSPDGVWSQPVTYSFKVLPPWFRTWWSYSLYVIIAFLLLFGGFQWRTASLRNEKEVLEQTVKERTAEVVKQKELVEEKNKDILDSITYAKSLQDAILPPLSLIKNYFPEFFLLYQPKDIVAGDFYWMERTGDIVLIAAADCTGHGVPGALVSVVCSNALNRTVKEFHIIEPGRILDKVCELLMETFEKSENNVRDGMDISLCCINTKTKEAQWSGAYNSLLYSRDGKMHEVPADTQPVGKSDDPQPFNTHKLNLQKGDTLYLFTDGYSDQFGGPHGKKFMHKQMVEILLANATKSIGEQKNILEDAMDKWKGSLEQVDDILVMGLRI